MLGARRWILSVSFTSLIGMLGLFATVPAPPAMEQHLNVLIPMKDGVRLSANVFLPLKAAHLPAILIRTPYNKGLELPPGYYVFIERGYAVVMQDVRGRYGSEGIFRPMTQEVSDGDDTLNWIAAQSWSDGAIGMIGGSYVGIVQWKAALSGNPHLKAICPVVSGDDDYRDRFYSTGGALKLGHRLEWLSENLKARSYHRPDFEEFIRHVPLRTSDRVATGITVDMYQEALNHPTEDAYWKSISTRARIGQVKVPVLSIGGWYDNYVESDLDAFSLLQKYHSNNRIVVGPWPHNMSIRFPGVSFGPDAMAPVRRYQLDWFDEWVRPERRPESVESLHSPVHIFVMGANQWRDEQEWPLARTKWTAYYLGSHGKSNTADGDGVLSAGALAGGDKDQFTYDPKNPVPTAGGAICCNPAVFPWGPMDQRAVERRNDVLVYSTPALDRDLEITGPIRLILYASTSAVDTDFTGKLVDVFPDGMARNLTDGILRVRYYKGLDKGVKIRPNQVYQLTIDVGVTANVFRAGHRIRLEVSSSNFPRFDRNPNTGKPVADETKRVIAVQTVFHDRQYPSQILLPVIPGPSMVVAHGIDIRSRNTLPSVKAPQQVAR